MKTENIKLHTSVTPTGLILDIENSKNIFVSWSTIEKWYVDSTLVYSDTKPGVHLAIEETEESITGIVIPWKIVVAWHTLSVANRRLH